MIKRSIRYALALCQRVLFLLLTILLLTGLAIWWMAPGINKLRPDIEQYLTQELQLRDLTLGRLSWYWAWNIGIRADGCSFTNQDESLAVRKTQLSVQISPWQLLFGEVTPYKIHLAHGRLNLAPERSTEQGLGLLPGQLVMDDMTVAWHLGSYQGELHHFGMDFDEGRRRVTAHMPGVHLRASWDAALLPEHAVLKFDDIDWLPQPLQAYVEGRPSGRMVITRLGAKRWRIGVDAKGDNSAWQWSGIPFTLPFDAMHADLVVHAESDRTLNRIEIPSVRWRRGGDTIAASGQWYEGKLHLSATSPRLRMPLIWSWLQGMGDGDWRQWLVRMKRGQASGIKADLQLEWAEPNNGWPTAKELASMHYRVNGHVDGADIAPGLDEALITDVRGDIELDEAALHAKIASAQLPNGIGTAHATLALPWESTLLAIKGAGRIDAGQMHAWLDAKDAAGLQWVSAPSQVNFDLQWQPEEALPRTAEIRLKPADDWKLTPNGVAMTISGGQLNWRLGHGISAEGLQVHGELTEGTISFQASHQAATGWQITSLQANTSGDFAHTIRHFQLPIASPTGRYALEFTYSGTWQSRLNLTGAGWSNMLGQAKPMGMAMEIRSEGSFDAEHGHLDIDHIECPADDFQLEGSGEFGPAGLKVVLTRLQTPAFAGSVAVRAPFGSDPWEMDVQASKLDRKALPQQLPHTAEALAGKPWSLRAKVGEFIWDDAQMQDVSISLASKADSVGVFKAATADIGAIKVKNISAMFAMPGKGEIDLRHFGASMGAQSVTLSAWLTPNPKGGMRWRGFAELDGDFGRTMSRAGMSNLFSGGHMRALFSGQGEVLREQQWWQGLQGRLRMRVDDGQVLTGGTLTKFLSAISLKDLPKLLFGQREDLKKKGLFFNRLQVEATLHDQTFNIKKMAMRSPAMDMAGHGVMDLENGHIDLLMAVRPFQNLDAMLSKIPLVRDLVGGAAHSIMRKAYHMHGPVTDAKVEEITPEAAGLASPGLVESLFRLPELWFDAGKSTSH